MKYKFLLLVFYGILNSYQQDQKTKNQLKALPDINGDGFSDQGDFYNAMKNRHMNKHEISEIFAVADKNSDGLISQQEWNSFYQIFVKPYQEKCDIDGDFLLDEIELTNCIKSVIPSSKKFSQALEVYEKSVDPYKKLINIFGTQKKGDKRAINFNQYLFIRRGAYSWQECNTQYEFIVKVELKCASNIMIPDKILNDNELNYIYNLSQEYLHRSEVPLYGQLRPIGFISLFRKFYEYNRFYFNHVADSRVQKKEFIKAIEDGRLDNNKIQPSTIEKLYRDIQNNEKYAFDFKSYFLLMSRNDDIQQFGDSKNKGFLNKEQFLKFFESKPFSIEVMNLIDSIQLLKNEDDKSKELSQKTAISERQFMNPYQSSFLQIKMKVTKNLRQKQDQELKPNQQAREIIFNVLDDDQDNLIDSADLVTLTKLLYIFKQLQQKMRNKIFVSDIQQNQAKLTSPLPISVYDTNFLNKLADYDEKLPLNALQFLGFYQYDRYFKFIIEGGKINGQGRTFINKEHLVKGLKRFGLNLANDDLIKSLKLQTNVQQSEKEQQLEYDYDRAFKLSQRAYSKYIQKLDILSH